MSNHLEVEARCRVEGLSEMPEGALCDLMEAAAHEVERRVPTIGPVVAIEGDVLTALGSFELTPGRYPFEDAEVLNLPRKGSSPFLGTTVTTRPGSPGGRRTASLTMRTVH